METTLQLTLTGIKPMVQHNIRLANPLDPYTRAIAAISKKRRKTDEDIAELAHLEARGGLYETPDGLVGLPAENVWKCIHDAAKAYRLGTTVQAALIQSDEIWPIYLDGQTLECSTFLEDDPNRLYFTSVGVARARVMRARPRIPAGWVVRPSFTLLTDVLQPELLEPVLERAGRLIGLCERRPMFGTFEAEMEVLT